MWANQDRNLLTVFRNAGFESFEVWIARTRDSVRYKRAVYKPRVKVEDKLATLELRAQNFGIFSLL